VLKGVRAGRVGVRAGRVGVRAGRVGVRAGRVGVRAGRVKGRVSLSVSLRDDIASMIAQRRVCRHKMTIVPCVYTTLV
jgi:hypothetical protein